jgi:oligopeptide/dipeptide ABC transporter ATP-binding protein
LLAAAPHLRPGTQTRGALVEGEPPSPRKLPSGCAFRTRCAYAALACTQTIPSLSPSGDAHEVACLRWPEIVDEGARVSATAASDGMVPV